MGQNYFVIRHYYGELVKVRLNYARITEVTALFDSEGDAIAYKNHLNLDDNWHVRPRWINFDKE